MTERNTIRSFANPGYCPARSVRIRNDRYYLVTFQNVEHRIDDAILLAEGEYVRLLPGAKAREARDARLNHCNRIREWTGEVWELTLPYGVVRYYPSSADAERARRQSIAKTTGELHACIEANRRDYLDKSDAELSTLYGKCRGWDGVDAPNTAQCRELRNEARQRIADCQAKLGALTVRVRRIR